MPPEQLNLLVAEHVMGWQRFYIHSGTHAYLADPKADGITGIVNGQDKPAPNDVPFIKKHSFLPNYTEDIAHDFRVLQRVKQWDIEKWDDFDCNLAELLHIRNYAGVPYVPQRHEWSLYMPGDFSKVALFTLELITELKALPDECDICNMTGSLNGGYCTCVAGRIVSRMENPSE
jgi:hypothetical protein